jgi:hypothetical protein
MHNMHVTHPVACRLFAPFLISKAESSSDVRAEIGVAKDDWQAQLARDALVSPIVPAFIDAVWTTPGEGQAPLERNAVLKVRAAFLYGHAFEWANQHSDCGSTPFTDRRRWA